MSTDSFNAAMLILRIGLGVVFLAHGIKHARGKQKTSNWFGSIGFQQPTLNWFMSTATEIGVGALLIAGLLTPFAAAGLIGTMFVAFWSVHRAAGFFITNFMKEGVEVEGWEYVFSLSFAALAVAVAGPGDWSLDNAFGIATDLDGWVGAAIAGGGLALGVATLAAFYRPPRVPA